MAKSRSFFGLRRGSTKSFTFSILGGQQITKDRVVEVKNPRTYAQQFQRAKFASMVKFFKQLPSGLLTYAYEDKKPNESYYNAFMRHNNNRICTYLAAQNAADGILASGDVIISDGSLGEVKLSRATSGDSGHVFVSNIAYNTEGELNTVADLSKVLIAAGFKSGDIVNCVVQVSEVNVANTAPFFGDVNKAASMLFTFSCYIDVADNTSIVSHVIAPLPELADLIRFSSESGRLALSVVISEDLINMNAALIISRRTSSGVKVTTSNMTCPSAFPLEKMLFDAYAPSPSRPGVASTNWTELVAQSYDGQEGDAILQGGLVTEGEVVLAIESTSQLPHKLSGLEVTFTLPTTLEEIAEKNLRFISSQGSFYLSADGSTIKAAETTVANTVALSSDKKTITISGVQSAFNTTDITDVQID